VWTNSISGVNAASSTVSYYVKGQVLGFLLDATIRRATGDSKSLDDAMKLAYQRYGGERGFTPEQFRSTVSEVAGVDLTEWFREAVASTEELDYTEALDWFGLRFTSAAGPPVQNWKLDFREDATETQKNHFRKLLSHSPP